MTTSSTIDRYVAPGSFTKKIFNPTVAFLTKRGLSIAGSRVLTVAGRTSGEPRHTAVNVLTLDGERYLVAPRGVTAWVKNVRAAGTATLRVGRRVETITPVELADADKVPVLRAYITRWGWEVGQFFDNLDKHSDDARLLEAAADFPVFRVVTA